MRRNRRVLMLGGGDSSAIFIGHMSVTAGVGTSALVTFPGASPGDLAIVQAIQNTPANTPSGWTLVAQTNWPTLGYPQQLFSKVLTAGDISSGVTFTAPSSGHLYTCVVYRRVTTASPQALYVDGATTLSVPGFVKSGASKGLVGFYADRDPASVVTEPSGWTRRGLGFATYFCSGASDIPITAYVNNTPMSWTRTGGYSAGIFVVELA